MKLYRHLLPREARKIIALANQKLSRYKIAQLTGLTPGKIRRCLEQAKIESRIEYTASRYTRFKVTVKYSFNKWLDHFQYSKELKAFNQAKFCASAYIEFIEFCKKLYETRILGTKVKRSANEYIRQFKIACPGISYPKKSWIYYMAKSEYYTAIESRWFINLGKVPTKLPVQIKAIKYNHISERPNKAELRKMPGNLEIDSVIGKATDKFALQTTIDLFTGKVTIAKYNRSAAGFAKALRKVIKESKLKIKTLTMDNGLENNELHTVVNANDLYNCRAYCSGDKGTIENMHRRIRQVIKKGISIDSLSNEDIHILQNFVNNYYSKTFDRL